MTIPGQVYTIFVIGFAVFTAMFVVLQLARRRSR